MTHRAWLGVALLWALPAGAQPGGAGTQSQAADSQPGRPLLIRSAGEQADALYERAKPLVDAARWPEARALLTQAYRLKKSYDIASSYGRVLLGLHRYREAAEALAVAQASTPSDLDEAQRVRLERRAAEAHSEIAVVRVHAADRDATILIDGRAANPIDGALYLEPGEHRFEAEQGGARSEAVVRQLSKGQSAAIELGRVAGAGSGAGAKGRLPIWPLLVGGVAALGTAGAGVGLLLAGRSKQDDAALLEEQTVALGGCHGSCPGVHSAYADADTLYDASVGLFVTSGVLVLATAAYTIFAPSGDDEPPTTAPLLPVAGPGYGGIVLNHSF